MMVARCLITGRSYRPMSRKYSVIALISSESAENLWQIIGRQSRTPTRGISHWERERKRNVVPRNSLLVK